MILFTCKRQYKLKELKEIEKTDRVHVQDVCVNNKPGDPMSYLSPFTVFPNGLHVLGHQAASVDGIWQGMKVFKNQPDIDVDMITGKKDFRKVKGRKPLGHKLGDTLLTTPGEARRSIYVPAFNALLQDPNSLKAFKGLDLLARFAEEQKRDLILVDWDVNGQIDDGKPFAHDALLAALLNVRLNLTTRWSSFEANPIQLDGIELFDPIDSIFRPINYTT